MKNRLAFAVLIALVAYVAGGQLASALAPSPMANPDRYFWLLAGISAVVCFLAALAGSWVARGRFLLPALLLWVIPTAASLIAGYRLQVPAEPITFGSLALHNLPMLCATLAGTLAGVFFGKFVAAHKMASDTQAAT